jgi:molybdopterin-containing oxidoreductase family iron-sulfur binding subunit
MNRRTFLKLVGMGSMSVAAGCSPYPDKHFYAPIHHPDDMVAGSGTWYASTCRECPAGCGILAKNREGRVVKVEGNPLHPINQGKLCMRGQAALQAVFNPDRLKTPLLKVDNQFQPISFGQALALIKKKADAASASGSDRVRMVTETVGDTQLQLFSESLTRWNADKLLVFEAFAYDSLKSANKEVFGINGLPSYHIDQADMLLTFGADFLETWLSPVEYARKFKQMHAFQNGSKGAFVYVGPYQSLTCANADLWIKCRPGGEAHLALGLLGEMLRSERARNMPEQLRSQLQQAFGEYGQESAVRHAGIPADIFAKLADRLKAAQKPLVLGTGSGSGGRNALQTDVAVNYLNAVLDPNLSLLDFEKRHRAEQAASRAEGMAFFNALTSEPVDLLFLNQVNPVHALPPRSDIQKILENPSLFIVSFGNFLDDTSQLADLVLPVRMPLESWEEYGGKTDVLSTLQPASGSLSEAPLVGDVLLQTAFGQKSSSENYKAYLINSLVSKGRIRDEVGWIETLQRGGSFTPIQESDQPSPTLENASPEINVLEIKSPAAVQASGLDFVAAPSIRFFDGRGANRPWLNEIPDPVTRISWQTPVIMHPQTAAQNNIRQEDVISIKSKVGSLEAAVYVGESVSPDVLLMGLGQGHDTYGRYARNNGLNPLILLDDDGCLSADNISIKSIGRRLQLAAMYGSRTQQGRPFALTTTVDKIKKGTPHKKVGLTMDDFPLVLPLAEGYAKARDFYPPLEYQDYRWSMIVDLDRCIGCGACAVACYAENNIGIVGETNILNGREMAWMSIERYVDENQPDRLAFLPMFCQQCSNAPCESVCPVYAPHHNKEGINNQIYNRCIGTRYCSQNCPYKVRRFNWFTWKWPDPMNLQLNPDVTVRSKGVMEKCSFCIQRIKVAHNRAKNEKRKIRDGEITPACVQTCPTGALVFGNLKDTASRVRKLTEDPRAYQIMGYLNTKPAAIYLKKVVQEI